MSSKIPFMIFCGEGSVDNGPTGVQLNGFTHTRKAIDRPIQRTFHSIYNWLEKGLRVNRDTHFLTVQTLVNWANEGAMWELMTISSTAEWKFYVENAVQHGWTPAILVRSYPIPPNEVRGGENETNRGEAGEDAHNVHEVEEQINEVQDNVQDMQENLNVGEEVRGQGVADLGERIPSIVQEMENENLEAAHMEEYGDSSDEEYPVPADWSNPGFGNPVAHDARTNEYQYRENEVVKGALYHSSEAVKEAVKNWAVSLRKEFRVVKSSPRVYDVACVKEGCPWRVHAYKGVMKSYWKVSIVVDHTCLLDAPLKSHSNMTTDFVASDIYGLVMEKMHLEPKMIIRHIELKYHFTISYAKAWRAKQRAFEMRFGTYEASYDNLPHLLQAIMQRNPGGAYSLKAIPHPSGGPSILQRTFFCLGPCVKAFQYCLPVLCIDGTFLTGKYKGTILSAIGVDGNNQLLPVAFAFVESENIDSWVWFLQLVKVHVVVGRPNVCLISDRHAGILEAINRLHNGVGTSPPLWPDVHSRWCKRHMGANFHEHFKSKDLMDLFKRLASQNQERKFNVLWKRLDQLTAKHGGDDADPPHSRPFSDWIRDLPKQKWALLYDTDGRRYGIMTTNNAESYNMVLRGVRSLPLVAIVEFIMYGCAKYFRERWEAVSPSLNNASVLYGCIMNEYMQKKVIKAELHDVRLWGSQELRFDVRCKGRAQSGSRRSRTTHECVITNDGRIHCSCYKPTLLHKPCSHIIAACREVGLGFQQFVSEFYKKAAIAAVWNQEVYSTAMLGTFTQENIVPAHIPDPETKITNPGRRRTRRIRNGMDEAEAGKQTRCCTMCGGVGHTYKRCPMLDNPGSAEAGPSGNAADGAPPSGIHGPRR